MALIFPFIATALTNMGISGAAASVLGTAATGALTGAGLGAARTAIGGGDLGDNMLQGAAMGGVSGPILGALGAGAAPASDMVTQGASEMAMNQLAGDMASKGAVDAFTGGAIDAMIDPGLVSGVPAVEVAMPDMLTTADAATAAAEGFDWQSPAKQAVIGQNISMALTPPPPEGEIPIMPDWALADMNFDPMNLFPKQPQEGWLI
jgi:hypothetical protein